MALTVGNQDEMLLILACRKHTEVHQIEEVVELECDRNKE